MTVEVTRIPVPRTAGVEADKERNDRIVERWNTTELSMREIGEEFGLKAPSIHRIIHMRLAKQQEEEDLDSDDR